MNPDKHNRAKKCLDRARLITDRLLATKEPAEMAAEISSALLFRISQPQFVPASPLIEVPPTSTASARGLKATEHYQLMTFVAGGLREGHPLENLIAELVATVSPTPLPGPKKKRDRNISFAFIVAALSALASDPHLTGDLRRICEAAYEEAEELAAAAVCESHSDTFGEMQRGIQAFLAMEYEHGKFSRHVVAAHQARRNLLETSGDGPSKKAIVKESRRILQANGKPCYGESNSARWREVFIAAGQSTLPQERNGSVSGDG